MRTYLSIGLFILTLVLTSCNTGMQRVETHAFDLPPDGWTVGFADLPANHDPELYQLESDLRALPSGLGGDGLYVQGHNRSDDLFMFITREVRGLKPRTAYRAMFVVDIATCIPEGMVGIGGSPGESVYVKAGAAPIEPIATEVASGYLRMNIDKGNQSREGADMINLGNIAHPDLDVRAGETFKIKRLDNKDRPLRAVSDAGGRLWIVVGTDSGFEGLTTLYYGAVAVELVEEPDE